MKNDGVNGVSTANPFGVNSVAPDGGDAAACPSASVNIIDYQQRRGALLDIIDQAIGTYDQWMLDDNYDAQTALTEIVKRMRERADLYRPVVRDAAAPSLGRDVSETKGG